MSSKILFVGRLLNGGQMMLRASPIFHIQKVNKVSHLQNELLAVGNREIVGFGCNGTPCYFDRWDLPFPSIRFRACTPEIMAVREKERGDWRKLSIDEKKTLYRASFCQTFAEINANGKGRWKEHVGWALMFLSLGIWTSIFIRLFVLPDAPSSFSKESRIAQYYRQVDMNAQPITGLYRPPGAEYREFKYNPLNKQTTE